MPECVAKGRCRGGRNNGLVTALNLLSISVAVASAAQQPGYTHLRSPFAFPAAHLEQQQQQQQGLSHQLHTCTSLQGPACLHHGSRSAARQPASESLLPSGLLPQRNGTKGGQMKLQLLRMPVNSAGSLEELMMQFTSQEADGSGQNHRDAPEDTSDGPQLSSNRQSMQEVIKGLEKSGSEVLYEADEASLQDLERVVEALAGHIGVSSAGNFAETLRQTLAGLLTDAEMAAAGLLLDQGPASSFQGGPINKDSSSSSLKTEAGFSDTTGSMPQEKNAQAGHHEGIDPGSNYKDSGTFESDLSPQSQQQLLENQQHEYSERQPELAVIHDEQPATTQDAAPEHHAQSLQYEPTAALRASLARISSNRLVSQSQRQDHLAASQDLNSEQSASQAMAQTGAGLDGTGISPSGSMLDHEDDDWLQEPFVQPSEEDLQFEAEAIADMVREANLTALAQQLQSLYDEHEWAEEYE